MRLPGWFGYAVTAYTDFDQFYALFHADQVSWRNIDGITLLFASQGNTYKLTFVIHGALCKYFFAGFIILTCKPAFGTADGGRISY
jgi:hypothetical protein